MEQLSELHACFVDRVLKRAHDGVTETALPGVYFVRFPHPYACKNTIWPSSLIFGVQGDKEFFLDKQAYKYGAGKYVASPVDLPITSRVGSATKEKPYLAFAVPLPRADLVEILKTTKLDRELSDTSEPCKPFVGVTDERLLRCAIRLIDVLDDPQDAATVGPLVIREMVYYFLRTENGSKFLNFVRKGDRAHQVAQALEVIKNNPNAKVDLDRLAASAHMSRAKFFRTFKSATAMSPVQYQKQLRLWEAKGLPIETGESVENTAYKVGYKSISQFSRDYARRFGNPPKRDTRGP